MATISAPTLVIHGADDGLVPPEHGEHTASLIKGSAFSLVSGMAHDMPEEVNDPALEMLRYGPDPFPIDPLSDDLP